jgi:hypothetical protein
MSMIEQVAVLALQCTARQIELAKQLDVVLGKRTPSPPCVDDDEEWAESVGSESTDSDGMVNSSELESELEGMKDEAADAKDDEEYKANIDITRRVFAAAAEIQRPREMTLARFSKK